MRKPNEIDFWRGFALVMIFINHIPGIYFERFTFRNVSLSDSAELFVFLAGWAMRKLAEGNSRPLPVGQLILRLGGRAVQVYIAQTVITEIAIALLAAASIVFDAPFLLDWHNASAVFQNPVEAHVGLVLLTHQLGYFNILPLYVVLMFAAPLIAVIHRYTPLMLLPLSLAIYIGALTTGINFQTWPVQGNWFFDPLCWQLIYILGFSLAGKDGLGGFARAHRKLLWWIAVPIVLAGAIIARLEYSPDPINVPSPNLFFMFDKTYLSPARLIHALALAALFAGSFRFLTGFAALPSAYLSMLGRNSLNVFCFGSLLSLCGQIFRYVFEPDVAVDGLVVILGLLTMGSVAWLSEWRDQLRAGTLSKEASREASSLVSASS